jgi:mannose-6-phosphate isomerase-like protein (cupin superfamily)
MRPEDEDEILARAPARAMSGESLIIGKGGQLPPAEGFTLSRLVLAANEAGTATAAARPEVVFVQSGSAAVRTPEGTVTLGKGDTMTVPRGLERSYCSLAEGAELVVVRGAD